MCSDRISREGDSDISHTTTIGHDDSGSMLGLTEAQYARYATAHCKMAIGMWLLSGALRNLWLGGFCPCRRFYVFPIFAAALAFLGFVPYLFLLWVYGRLYARGDKVVAVGIGLLALLWWIGLLVIAPIWCAVLFVDAANGLVRTWFGH